MTQKQIKLDDYFLKRTEQYVHPNNFTGHSKGLYKIAVNTNGHVTSAESVTSSDILGNDYYNYFLTSSNYTPTLNSSITITCTVKNIYGDTVPNKAIQLYQNDVAVGNNTTTNNNGVATWTVTCSTAGIQKFSIQDTTIEIFVDTTSKSGHTHSTSDINNLSIPTKTSDLTNDSGFLSHQDITGKENTSNKVKSTSGWSSTTTDDHYPSEKLVKDSLDTKQGHLSLSSAEIDEYGNSIFTDDGSYFYSTNDRIYHDWADTDELHFYNSNGDDVNFDDISLNGHHHNISNITNLQSTLNDKIEASDLLELIYPVGSIYMSVNSTSPATLFGGTWVQIKDTFLLACGDTYSSDGDVATAQHGSATVTLTTNQIPSHNHQTGYRQSYGSGNAAGLIAYSSSVSTGNVNTTSTGGGQAHNNMPPYMAVYVWKRTG